MAKIHPDVTLDRVMEAVKADDNIGFCLACGAEHFYIEPDARKYACEECHQERVYGASQLLIEGLHNA